MKILFFVNSIGGGGAERVCANLAKQFISMGNRVDFIILFNRREYADKNLQCNFLRLKIDEKLSKRCALYEIVRKKKVINSFIRKEEEDGRYDLITAHLPLSHICASLSYIGNRCLYVQHTSLQADKQKRMLYRIFYKNKYNVCVSEGLRNEFISAMKYKKERVFTIYNPIFIQEIKEKANISWNCNERYILCVGRMSKEKRFDRAIEVFYQGGFSSHYQLVFLGDGEEREALRELAEKYQLQDSVVFAGWQQNVYVWMKNAELLLHTAEREALSMTLIEALASGTKLVASDCEFGADEILEKEMAKYVVVQDNIPAYIDAINDALLNFPLETARESVKRFDAKKIAEEYLRVYADCF